jgi:flagellar basal body-associated protein FliL
MSKNRLISIFLKRCATYGLKGAGDRQMVEEKLPEEKPPSGAKKSGPISKLGIGIIVVICILIGGFLLTRHSKGAVKQAPAPITYDLGEFTTNLSDASELRYVKTDVTLTFSNKAPLKEAQDNQALLRDSIITLLNSETSDDIMLNRTNIKDECMTGLNKDLSTGQVTNVYFSDLIMQ